MICRAMFRGERPTIEGQHYSVRDAINSPAPVTPGGPPIMIGGQGEKKTLRLMAQYAEMANFTSGFDELPRKLEVLAGHCADVGRDIDTINKTPLCNVVIGETMEEAEGLRNSFLRPAGSTSRPSTTPRGRWWLPGSSSAMRMRWASRCNGSWASASTASRSTCRPTVTSPRRSPAPSRSSRRPSADREV